MSYDLHIIITFKLQSDCFSSIILFVSSQLTAHIYSKIHLKYTVNMTSDSISFLEINTLKSEVFLAINRIQYLWRQRVDAAYLRK